MRAPPLSVIVVVALLVLAGCTGSPGGAESEPSPEAFPNASAVDPSAFDAHAAELSNASFTFESERNRTERNPVPVGENFTYRNDTSRSFVEPDASRYLVRFNGSFSGNGTIYSDGSTEYFPSEDGRAETRPLSPTSVFNESGEQYLWQGWFTGREDQLGSAAIEATYEREGIETFQGVSVMRYEADGADALPGWVSDGDPSSHFEAFSATVLLDEDGVIRYYEYEFVWADYQTRRIERTYTLSNIGSTDVEVPEWAEGEST